MKTISFRKTALLLSATLLPLLVSAQDKATLAVSSIKPTPALAASVNSKTVVESHVAGVNGGAKDETLVLDTKQELNRIIESLDGQLIDRINVTRKFEVVGRSDLSDVMKEQELGASGNVDAKTAAQGGKLAGAKYLLVATVDDFQDYFERAVFEGTGRSATKRVFRFSIVGKIYDSTGKLLESANFQTGNDAFKQIQQERNYSVNNGQLSDEMMVALSRSMAEQIANHLADVIFPAKVITKRDALVTINRGEGGGVAVGDLFNVFALGEELIDPDTKESLGREEVKVGKVKISEVNPKVSKAEVLEDTGIVAGAVLRKIK